MQVFLRWSSKNIFLHIHLDTSTINMYPNAILPTPHSGKLVCNIYSTNIRPQTSFYDFFSLHNNPFNVVTVPFWWYFGGILSGLFQLIIHPPPGGPNRVVHPMSTKISTHHHHWPARTNARHVCGSIERKMVTIGLWNRSPGHVVGCVGNAQVLRWA